MLFLGAGASLPFGVPTMEGFTRQVLNSFASDSRKRRSVELIIEKLEKSGFHAPDIEAIMDVLTARQDLTKARLSIGPRLVEFASNLADLPEDEEAKELLHQIEREIQTQCAKAEYEKSDNYYQAMFDKAPGGTQQQGGQKVATQFRNIFTTNYDLCIDSFLRNQEHSNGFEAKVGHERVFTGNWNQFGQGYFLCKLHGSIDWWEIGARVTQLSVIPGESLYRERIGGRMMVYPASEKYALRSPYAECLFRLREQLKYDELCWVIGYSFRDTPVNNAFNDILRSKPAFRIFSIGPHASIRAKTLEEPLRSRLKPLDVEFGTEAAITAIATSLNS
jgi:hypothetical protein